MRHLRRDARRIAEHFGLTYQAIEAEDTRVKRRYGSFDSNGVLRIRLTHAKTGKPLKYSSMIDTLCHELAHVKYFHHGPRFKALYERILEWARREAIYQPTPRGTAPAQRPQVPERVAAAPRQAGPRPGAPRRGAPLVKRPEPEQLGLFESMA